MIDVDLVGPLRLMQLVGVGMVERRRGVILSFGSQTAFSGGGKPCGLCRGEGRDNAAYPVGGGRMGYPMAYASFAWLPVAR